MLRRRATLLFLAATSCAAPSEDAAPGQDQAKVQPAASDALDLRVVFVHGVLSSDGSRQNAHMELADLEAFVIASVQARANSKVRLSTARVNLYTDENDALTSPRIDDVADGTGLPSANAWRSQLVKKTNRAFGDGGNIVFVGHSTGARTAAEITAGDFGFKDRVAGIVTLHGMIDALDRDTYDFIGPTSYVTGCKLAQGKGWCEYSGYVSGVAALDWVARERHVLSLVSWGQCTPSVWSGQNDKSLPLGAQSSPWSPGLVLAPAAGETYAPVHGTVYGNFCHSDLTSSGSPRHQQAVSAASAAIVSWLFDAAPRVVASETVQVPPLAANVPSNPIAVAASCPPGRRDGGKPDVVGVCKHPGLFDGGDHPVGGIDVADGESCQGSATIAHTHAGEKHAAQLWMKTYSVPEGGGLISTLR